MKLKAKKVKASHYEYFDVVTGKHVATIVRTGEYGRDNYPWDWYLPYPLSFNLSPEGVHVRSQGNGESKKECVDTLTGRIEQFGIRGL